MPNDPRARQNTQTVYFGTVLPGLEPVLADEIRAKIPDAALQPASRGKVAFATRLAPERLLTLRTADNLYRLIARFPVGPHKLHLPELVQRISELDLDFAFGGEPSGPSPYVVNASRTGKQSYSRFEAAEAAMRGIAGKYPRWPRGTAEHHGVEFRLDIRHGEAEFALRLTEASFRYRGAERSFAPAALRPTVAHAFVRLSKPNAADVFLDPCCGSGTILAERCDYPVRRILGGDLAEEAVQAARRNVPAWARKDVRRWDARQLPVDSGSVGKIVTNLPFGRQISSMDQIALLYRDIAQEMGRVLGPGGSAVVLAEDGMLLERAAEQCGLRCAEKLTLSLKGLQPTLLLLANRAT